MDALAQDQGADAMRRPIAGLHAHGRFDALVLATDRRGSRSRQATSEIFRCGLFEPEHGLVARVPAPVGENDFQWIDIPLNALQVERELVMCVIGLRLS